MLFLRLLSEAAVAVRFTGVDRGHRFLLLSTLQSSVAAKFSALSRYSFSLCAANTPVIMSCRARKQW